LYFSVFQGQDLKKSTFSFFEVKNDYFLVASRKKDMKEYSLLNGSLSPSQKINISKVRAILHIFVKKKQKLSPKNLKKTVNRV